MAPTSEQSVWPHTLKKSGFSQVPHALIDNMKDLGLSSSELTLILCLLRFKWNDKHPWPSYVKLSNLMGIHHRRVRQLACDLEKKNLLRRHLRRKPGSKSETNEFDIGPLISRLQELESNKSNSPRTKTDMRSASPENESE